MLGQTAFIYPEGTLRQPALADKGALHSECSVNRNQKTQGRAALYTINHRMYLFAIGFLEIDGIADLIRLNTQICKPPQGCPHIIGVNNAADAAST